MEKENRFWRRRRKKRKIFGEEKIYFFCGEKKQRTKIFVEGKSDKIDRHRRLYISLTLVKVVMAISFNGGDQTRYAAPVHISLKGIYLIYCRSGDIVHWGRLYGHSNLAHMKILSAS